MDFTIEEIEKLHGDEYEGIVEPYGLPIWYDGIRKKKLSELREDDIARLIRQDLYVDYAIEEGLKRVKQDPSCGVKYPGEVIHALSTINKKYWIEYPVLSVKSLEIIQLIRVNYTIIKNDDYLVEEDKVEIYESLFEIEKNIKIK
ncbi:contact-dependent growth inhibition system immunity protein [Marininema halotolerans]|uniref:Uncharacterized protein n=1 Tax=Marininema halotolerans TaxID=1155944 RepID=A0A1I6UN08_9BACL|nr:contact-dependent growth inhibition system immunity protein [Marininema halotolerans]SFT02754.1 hypothetical protein SAMN05444972_11836 [Marininema halotolerans]